jgi:hypothetical protein
MSSVAVITNAGLAILPNRLRGVGNEPLYFAWGEGTGVAGITDTTLSTEASDPRTLMVSQSDTVSVVGDSYKLTGAIVSNGVKTITNWGVFDAPTGGNLLLHESIIPGEDYGIGQIGAFLFRLQFMRG